MMNKKHLVIIASLFISSASFVSAKSMFTGPLTVYKDIGDKSLKAAHRELSEKGAALVIDAVNGKENPFYINLSRNTKITLTQMAINLTKKANAKNKKATLNALTTYQNQLKSEVGR